jgi:hypothetical protein
MAQNGDLNETPEGRIEKGTKMPGWTHRSEFDWIDTMLDPEAGIASAMAVALPNELLDP